MSFQPVTLNINTNKYEQFLFFDMNHKKDLPSASIGQNELGNNDGLNCDKDFGSEDGKLKSGKPQQGIENEL